jgi:hypothetical protein
MEPVPTRATGSKRHDRVQTALPKRRDTWNLRAARTIRLEPQVQCKPRHDPKPIKSEPTKLGHSSGLLLTRCGKDCVNSTAQRKQA